MCHRHYPWKLFHFYSFQVSVRPHFLHTLSNSPSHPKQRTIPAPHDTPARARRGVDKGSFSARIEPDKFPSKNQKTQQTVHRQRLIPQVHPKKTRETLLTLHQSSFTSATFITGKIKTRKRIRIMSLFFFLMNVCILQRTNLCKTVRLCYSSPSTAIAIELAISAISSADKCSFGFEKSMSVSFCNGIRCM